MYLCSMEQVFSYKVKHFEGSTRRYCQMLKLKDNPEGIKRYVQLHSEQGQEMWKEIREGIRQVGILEMEIYLCGNTLFMIVEAPDGFDWKTAMAKLATLPRQQEWEETVAEFQDCNPNDTSDGKWKMMERIFYIYD